jgi:hypothetical protein
MPAVQYTDPSTRGVCPLRRPASPLLTPIPDMRVLDAQVYMGCHHFVVLMVCHQLTLAGIERAACGADSEILDLSCSYPVAAEVADCRRYPRYLTRGGNFYNHQCPRPWLAPIPATTMHPRYVSRGSQLSPCAALDLKDNVLLIADGNERLTQGLRERIYFSSHTACKSHWGLCLRPHALASTPDVSIPNLSEHVMMGNSIGL